MSQTTQTECRIGNIEGPFARPMHYQDGSRIPADRQAELRIPAKYWVVRVLVGTRLEDRRYPTRAKAQAAWNALPAAHAAGL